MAKKINSKKRQTENLPQNTPHNPCFTEKIFIGIIHFGEFKIIEPLVDFLAHQEQYHILVLDHNPRCARFPKRFQVFHDPSNPGFAKGMNYLFRIANNQGGQLFIGLNNDCLPEPRAIDNIVKGLLSHNTMAVQGLLVNPDRQILTARHILHDSFHFSRSIDRHKTIAELSKIEELYTDFICAAFFAVNLKKLPNNLFFDDEFFLYHEDIEWSLRLREKQGLLPVISNAIAEHLESASSGGIISCKGIMLRWKSLLLYLRKTKRGLWYSLLSGLFFILRMLLIQAKYRLFLPITIPKRKRLTRGFKR